MTRAVVVDFSKCVLVVRVCMCCVCINMCACVLCVCCAFFLPVCVFFFCVHMYVCLQGQYMQAAHFKSVQQLKTLQPTYLRLQDVITYR